MSFSDLASSVPKSLVKTYQDKSRAAWRREVQERAALLMRLGHSKPAVVARIGRTLSYELEPFAKLAVQREVSGLVDAVYARR